MRLFSSVCLEDDLNDSEQELEVQMETYRNIKRNNKIKEGRFMGGDSGALNLDLTKAKTLQHNIAKAMIENKTIKSSVKMLELEETNQRLTELIQKLLEDNEKLKRQNLFANESFQTLTEYNKKLCFLVQHYNDKLRSMGALLRRYSNVHNFFRELYKNSNGTSEAFDGRELFRKIYQALDIFNKYKEEFLDQDTVKAEPVKTFRQISYFQTI